MEENDILRGNFLRPIHRMDKTGCTREGGPFGFRAHVKDRRRTPMPSTTTYKDLQKMLRRGIEIFWKDTHSTLLTFFSMPTLYSLPPGHKINSDQSFFFSMSTGP